ncbi:hypothetical protein PoB_005938100 [Plakobranchus ocellatus]|uniref:Uncharacterized protein n=1 Tax=Plakobranchus ocellatus TaxID=259542 RepID=A0AAV4CC37_9GAST|nr:hypothetical protein PoB_005938100 [Plakobranchus ocellatus]
MLMKTSSVFLEIHPGSNNELYPDLYPCQTLRREDFGSASTSWASAAAGCFTSCPTRFSLPNPNYASISNDINANNNHNSDNNDGNSNSIDNSTFSYKSHHLSDWREEDQTSSSSNMFRDIDVRPGCKTQRIAPTLRQVADLVCARTKEREYCKTCIAGHMNCCFQCGPTLTATSVRLVGYYKSRRL